MSRLSDSRNPPGLKCPSRMKRIVMREKQPSYNAPIALHGVCRSALNEAIRDKNIAAADHIAKTKHLALYGRMPKMELLNLLAGILRGARIVR
jgi:hypothetical protein